MEMERGRGLEVALSLPTPFPYNLNNCHSERNVGSEESFKSDYHFPG